MLPASVFCVALLYSSVGHGGASGYLAVMSVFAFSPARMAATALVLNLLVSACAFITYKRAGHFKGSRLYPFLILSIPMAWLGGGIRLPVKSYALLLAAALIFTAWRITTQRAGQTEPAAEKTPDIFSALLIGAAIGLVSGIVGIGGGIFLSSVLILAGWSGAKQASAVAAPFIFINSVAGLIPRLQTQSLDWGSIGIFALLAFAGGILGSHFGAHRFTAPVLRKILAATLLMASAKLVILSLA